MKTKLLLLNVLLSVMFVAPHRGLAQGTAFTYQGRLNNGGIPANGFYDLAFSLFTASNSVGQVATTLTNTNTAVNNGQFTVLLDFGAGVFTGTNLWLQIGVRTNGGGNFTTLSPLQALTPAPYAIFANTASNLAGTLSSAQLAGTYGNPVTFNNGANTFDGSFYGQFFGSTFIGGSFVGNFIGTGSGLADVWHTGGNLGTTPGVNFLGTTDNQPLVIKVNGQQTMRYEPTTDSPNIIGGWSGNYVQPGLPGATIGGGGSAVPFNGKPQPNVVTNNGNYGTIAGGYNNTIKGYGGAILGGSVNFAIGDFATVGGGQFNTNFGDHAFIGAGVNNALEPDYYSSIVCGFNNIVQSNAGAATVVGGGYNVIQTNGSYSFIGGGYGNIMSGYLGAIVGGLGNAQASYAGIIVGGLFNSIEGTSDYSAIVGGYSNTIQTNSEYAFIGGGEFNWIQTNAWGAMIAGGYQNTIKPGSGYSVIAGGQNNLVDASSGFSAIGGGVQNAVQSNSFYATIGGGIQNIIRTNGSDAVIAGGYHNSLGPNAYQSFIGGGILNVIQTNAYQSVIAGGNDNQMLAGADLGAIGGGTHNRIGGPGGTVPGGNGNGAFGLNSFAAGTDAQATNDGSFVLTDLQYVNYYSTSNNQLSARFRGGIVFTTGGAGMTLDGQPVLAGVVPNGDLSGTYTNALTLNNPGNSFTGNGGGLTGLNASQLTSGTVPLAQLPASVVTNNESGVTLTGVFSGNGGGLTNVNAATLGGLTPASVVTNNESGVTLTGAFNGNGGGLTNVNAATLGGLSSSNFWSTTGNAGTTPGANFIGTTDNQRLLIRGSFVGIGRTGPVTGADVFSVDAPVSGGNYGGMYINTTNAAARPFYGYSLAGSGGTAYHYVDGTDGNKWKLSVGGDRVVVTQTGNVGIGNTGPTNLLMVGNARCDGSTWINASDRNLKDNFVPISPREILAKVAGLPIAQWNYKSDTNSAHLGPVAQDFRAAFGLGADDKSIATVDEGGVALAAIQGLNQKLEDQAEALKDKDARIHSLESRLVDLEKIVARIAHNSSPGQ